jgi:hypothetical protein
MNSAHHWIGNFHLEQLIGLTDGNNLPLLVSLELRERKSVWYLQRILVWSGKSDTGVDVTIFRQ